jgi:hypothetical protein
MTSSRDAAPRRSFGPWLRLGVTLIIAAFFLRVVLKQTTLHALGQRLDTANWPLMIAGLVLFYAVYVFRGLRIHVMTRGQISLDRCTAAAAFYQMLLTYMPAGLGNVALPAILSRYGGVRTTSGTKMLIAIKLLDTAVICGVACIAGLTAAHLGPIFRTISLFAGVCAAIGLAGLFWPHRLGPIAIALWRRASRGKPSRTGTWIESVLTVSDAAAFHRRLPALFGCSMAFGLGRVIANWTTLNALGVHLSVWQAGYQWAFVSLAGALPFQPPAGLGLSDAIRMALLFTLGQAVTSAAEVVVISRAIVVPLDMVMTALSWLYLARRGAAHTAEPAPPSE